MAFHSKNYYKFKMQYDRGLCSAERLRTLVGLATGITAEEYEQITGEVYAE